MTHLRNMLPIFLVLFIVGCTPYQMTLTNVEHSSQATPADKVQILFQGDKVPPMKELGSIVVSGHSEEQGVQFLREKAGTIGADAVIDVEVKIETRVLFIVVIPIPVHSYLVSGTAVKFIN